MFHGIRVSRLAAISASAAFGMALFLGSASPVMADSLGDKAVVTFDRPVEVPGKVLPPGTYVFKSVNNSQLIQVFSGDEKRLFTTLNVVLQDRPAGAVDDNCLVQLGKIRTDAPQEIEAYFPPGRSTGFQFVYPAARPARGRS